MLGTLGFKLGATLAGRLPIGDCYFLADRVSDLFYLGNSSGRRAVRENLRQVLGEGIPEGEIRRLGRAVFRNFGRFVAEYLKWNVHGQMPDAVETKLEGLDRVRAEIDGGRPVVLVTAHLGNWELGGAVLARERIPVTVMARDHVEPALTRFFQEWREREGLRVVSTRSGVRPLLEALLRGESVAVVVDRPIGNAVLESRFFGRPAALPRAHISAALRADAKIFPGFVVRDDARHYRIVIEEAISPRGATIRERVRSGVEQCLAVFERYIRLYPEQWYVFEPIWENGTPARRNGDSR
jgi:KDO2-lipid IV(A) lauroyltransferase